jgi:hypothetical protein
MLDRAAAAAKHAGIEDRVRLVETDLNAWRADTHAHIYFANHSLHHVLELEHLFGEIAATLDDEGVFLVNDMVGRNGHQRWPEAATIVHGIWEQMPERYRFNHYTGRVDSVYPDTDCSVSSFEGVRAEDILPLLLERFHAQTYVTFANVIDPFVDRVYGPNFDIENEEDIAFVEQIAQLDQAALELATLTPTHLVGAFRPTPVECRYPKGRSPERTVHSKLADPVPDPRIAELERIAADAQGKYQRLRARKSVRLALKMAELSKKLPAVGRR